MVGQGARWDCDCGTRLFGAALVRPVVGVGTIVLVEVAAADHLPLAEQAFVCLLLSLSLPAHDNLEPVDVVLLGLGDVAKLQNGGQLPVKLGKRAQGLPDQPPAPAAAQAVGSRDVSSKGMRGRERGGGEREREHRRQERR